jgi:hypothetical protein
MWKWICELRRKIVWFSTFIQNYQEKRKSLWPALWLQNGFPGNVKAYRYRETNMAAPMQNDLFTAWKTTEIDVFNHLFRNNFHFEDPKSLGGRCLKQGRSKQWIRYDVSKRFYNMIKSKISFILIFNVQYTV